MKEYILQRLLSNCSYYDAWSIKILQTKPILHWCHGGNKSCAETTERGVKDNINL